MSLPKWHWKNLNEGKNNIGKMSKGWKNLEKCPYKKNGKNIACPICGTMKYFKLARLKRGAKYCSRKCSDESRKGIIPSNLKNAQNKSPIKNGNKLASLNTEDKNWRWQKENPSYRAVHGWIIEKYGKANKCENKNCIYPRKNARGIIMSQPKTYQWANISRQYKRDRNDFLQLCASCHKLYDIAYRQKHIINYI